MINNITLLEKIRRCTPTEMASLTRKIGSATKLNLLVKLLLENVAGADNAFYYTRIYKQELATIPVKTIKNRFYKLREKLLLLLPPEKEMNTVSVLQSDMLLPEEETHYNILKSKLHSATEPATLLKQLDELEKKCWAKNIFELLPSILGSKLSIKRILFIKYEKQEVHLLKYSTQLLYDLNQCLVLYTQMAMYMRENKSDKCMILIKKMHYIVKKNKAHLRFRQIFNLCRLHLKLYENYGKNYLKYDRVITNFRSIITSRPDIPILKYEYNYTTSTLFTLHYEWAIYNFNKLNFSEMHVSIQKLIALLQQNKLNTSLLFRVVNIENLLKMLTWTEKDTEGYKLLEIYKNDPTQKSQINGIRLEAFMHSYLFPLKEKKIEPDVIEQLSEFSKTIQNLYLVKDINSTLLKCHIIKKNYADAINILNSTLYRKLYPKSVTLKFYHEFIRIVNTDKIKKDRLEKLITTLSKAIDIEINIGIVWTELKWLRNMAKYALPN